MHGDAFTRIFLDFDAILDEESALSDLPLAGNSLETNSSLTKLSFEKLKAMVIAEISVNFVFQIFFTT